MSINHYQSPFVLITLRSIKEPCDRAAFRQFSFRIVSRHLRIAPSTDGLHIDERRSGLCQGDCRSDSKRVSGDEAFDAGFLRPLLDDPTGTDDREVFRSNVSAAAYPAEQRSGSYFACFAVLMNRFERGFADKECDALAFLIRITGFQMERTPFDVPDIDRDHLRDAQQAITHEINHRRIPKTRKRPTRFRERADPLHLLPCQTVH